MAFCSLLFVQLLHHSLIGSFTFGNLPIRANISSCLDTTEVITYSLTHLVICVEDYALYYYGARYQLTGETAWLSCCSSKGNNAVDPVVSVNSSDLPPVKCFAKN